MLNSVIGDNVFRQDRVKDWASKIVFLSLKDLNNLKKPYKYIINSIIMQKTGAGLHTASSCFWNDRTDGIKIKLKFLYFCLS